MRRSAAPVLLALLLALGACGGGDEAADTASTTTTEPTTEPPTTRGAPPPTLAPVRTTVPGDTLPPGSTTTAPPASIDPVSNGQLLALIGDAEWDLTLPVPAVCMGDARFTASGPNGQNGGTLTCSVSFGIGDTAAFVRNLNRSRGIAGRETGGGTPTVRFTYADVATIELQDAGVNGCYFVATQTYPDPPTTTVPPEPLPEG